MTGSHAFMDTRSTSWATGGQEHPVAELVKSFGSVICATESLDEFRYISGMNVLAIRLGSRAEPVRECRDSRGTMASQARDFSCRNLPASPYPCAAIFLSADSSGSVMRIQAVCVAFCCCFAVATAQAEDWTRFRGPQGQGFAKSLVPVEWNNDKNLAWSLKLPGGGASSPIVVGDKVFVTCFSGDQGNQAAHRLRRCEQRQRNLERCNRREAARRRVSRLPHRARLRERHTGI